MMVDGIIEMQFRILGVLVSLHLGLRWLALPQLRLWSSFIYLFPSLVFLHSFITIHWFFSIPSLQTSPVSSLSCAHITFLYQYLPRYNHSFPSIST